MLIAVKSCTGHADRNTAIVDTWWTPEVRIFTGFNLGVDDSYLALPVKTQAICKWAVEREISHAAFVDTDTYVSVPRLLSEKFGDYTGYQLHETNYASGGAGYVLSLEAMKRVIEFDISGFKNEDEMVGAAMKAAGIPLVHDPRFSLFEDVLPTNNIISRHLSSRTFFKVEMMHLAHEMAHRKATA